MGKISCSLIFLLLISAGCTPFISRELKREISRDITFRQVINDPEAYTGKTVLISGIIIGSKNTKEGTLIEILQKQADIEGRPKDVDNSGEIKGKRVLPLGEIDYTYPLISIKEIHLFKVRKEERYYICPYPYRLWDYPYLYP
jgi:outer membrane lipoprotein